MRRAEFVMAAVMAVFSLYLMVKSAELPVGWVPGEGPGGGAFPFWLSLGMLLSSLVIIWRAWRGATPQARSSEPYMDALSLKLFLISAGSLGFVLLVSMWLGFYVAIPLLLLIYVRFVGRHSWLTTGSIVLGAPVVIFFFFEIGLKILLPKGITEELFYPLYGYFL